MIGKDFSKNCKKTEKRNMNSFNENYDKNIIKNEAILLSLILSF